jgi:AraC family transcriptional regulator
VIGLDHSRQAHIAPPHGKRSGVGSSSPSPIRALEIVSAPGMRIELWEPRASTETFVTNGCDVDALRFHLDDCPQLQTWTGGVDAILPACPAGSCSMLNYWPRRHWRGAGAKMIVFRLPHAALTQWAQENGHPHFDGLHFQPGVGFFDPVLANLALAMHRSLRDDRAATPLFTSMIFEAVLADVVKRFGTPKSHLQRGGLAGWQMRAIQRLVAGRMDSQVQLSELANTCSLSVSYFVKAFRVTTGVTPHQWLISRRIERARELLRSPALSLSDVAASCGFADQSHFTRTFSRASGVSPGAWRKQAIRGVHTDSAAIIERYAAQPSMA